MTVVSGGKADFKVIRITDIKKTTPFIKLGYAVKFQNIRMIICKLY